MTPESDPLTARAASPGTIAPVNLLQVRDLVIVRGSRQVLEIEQFAVAEHETVTVVGPNGAGKSTLLLAIATLLRPHRGQLTLRGQVVTRRRTLAYRRRIGLVLADPLLLDTSVYKNVAAGLRFRGIRGRAARHRIDDWLDRVGILALRNRPARQLSSGEAQRVSLARALVLDPQILLLDEPFASVDVAARAQLLDDTERLLRETSIGCVMVTHDLDEAARLGTRMAVLVNGRLHQQDIPERVFAEPADAEVAAFVGVENRLPGRTISTQDGLTVIDAHGHRLEAAAEVQPGRNVLCCLHPEAVTLRSIGRLSPDMPMTSARNSFQGRIVTLTSRGHLIRVTIDAGVTLIAAVTKQSVAELGLREGDQVEATFKATAVHLLPLPG